MLPALLLYGPTAVGKTRLLATLADLPIEVINADSMQVYSGMDIGTAKPDRQLQAAIPHHLIDICTPGEQYHVGRFVSDADALLTEIAARGNLPIVSGGTAYYLKHLVLGLPGAPPSDPAIRSLVAGRAANRTAEELHAELAQIDPESADRIAVNDRYRVMRALEVYEQTGRPLSSFRTSRGPRTDLRMSLVSVTRADDELRSRIVQRVADMFAQGLRREVEGLVRSGYGPGDPGMRAIGYREFFAADGTIRAPADEPDMVEEIATNTRRYAKRQRTFFRQLSRVVPSISIDAGDSERLRETALALLYLDSE